MGLFKKLNKTKIEFIKTVKLMATIKKQNGQVTVTDITVEAKIILANAMNAFCKKQEPKMTEKEIYIEQRKGYWAFEQGLSNEEATKKALEDVEFAF